MQTSGGETTTKRVHFFRSPSGSLKCRVGRSEKTSHLHSITYKTFWYCNHAEGVSSRHNNDRKSKLKQREILSIESYSFTRYLFNREELRNLRGSRLFAKLPPRNDLASSLKSQTSVSYDHPLRGQCSHVPHRQHLDRRYAEEPCTNPEHEKVLTTAAAVVLLGDVLFCNWISLIWLLLIVFLPYPSRCCCCCRLWRSGGGFEAFLARGCSEDMNSSAAPRLWSEKVCCDES